MFCPQCGSTQQDDLKFCKTCGANLQALRQLMATRDSEGNFDWSKTWVAEMFMSGEDAVRHQTKIEKVQGVTPEIKSQKEIKAGVITSSVGIGLMILLFVMMNGIIAGVRVSDAAIEILSRLWIAGIIPLMVGLALIVNGLLVSKRGQLVENRVANDDERTRQITSSTAENYLPPADTNDLAHPAHLSVTEPTTRQLRDVSKIRDTE